eukprot:TRINITY_DN1338_c0_g2_i1.p1 TRINITY_DN1338_c0_g2~~TRINITY_DN1338_c0_g2_i1.p1  ORF type:complete len:663 (-),score=159.25 TRINITY_DN1338_c0_g2_i1:93-2081(-)
MGIGSSNNYSDVVIKSTCVVPNSETPGYGPIHRHIAAKDELRTQAFQNVNTIHDNWKRGVSVNPSGPCLGTRFNFDGTFHGDYTWETYATVDKKVSNFGSGLVNLGLKKGDFVGIYSLNRPEYVVAEQACYGQSMTFISLYDTLGPDSVSYIINHSGMSTIACTQDKIKSLLSIAPKCTTLKTIIQIEPIGQPELIQQAEAVGVKLISFGEVCQNGLFKPHELNPPSPNDIASIMYTSGTTGLPKGVILTHGNLVSATSGAAYSGIIVQSDDVYISYLPMAHIFERAVQMICFGQGASIGFYQGSVPKLFDDIQALKPTLFASVPRLFNRLYDRVMQTIEATGGYKKFMFETGFNSKKEQLLNGEIPQSAVWDKLVFNNLRQKLGGRVRLMITGSAPISDEVYQFLKICFCCPVLQGYGLTETCAAGTITMMEDPTWGNVGLPLACNEIRLADVPEMKYTTANNSGEVCFRGPNIFKGYYKDEEKTKEAFDADGFFLTGDIGRWNPNGTLSIIDRKKNIFKLAQGEYVAAEYIESVYIKSKFVQQIFVYGDSFQSCLVGIVVPDPDVLLPYAREHNFPNADNFELLCKDPKVKELISNDLSATAKEGKLQGFEMVRAIFVEFSPFSVENDLLTPSFKAMRPKLKERYQTTIDALYESLPKQP